MLQQSSEVWQFNTKKNFDDLFIGADGTRKSVAYKNGLTLEEAYLKAKSNNEEIP